MRQTAPRLGQRGRFPAPGNPETIRLRNRKYKLSEGGVRGRDVRCSRGKITNHLPSACYAVFLRRHNRASESKMAITRFLLRSTTKLLFTRRESKIGDASRSLKLLLSRNNEACTSRSSYLSNSIVSVKQLDISLFSITFRNKNQKFKAIAGHQVFVYRELWCIFFVEILACAFAQMDVARNISKLMNDTFAITPLPLCAGLYFLTLAKRLLRFA